MRISVVYVDKAAQKGYVFDLPLGVTVKEAIEKSGVLQDFPQIDLAKQAVGIYSEVVSLNHRLKENNRIEIYRPLEIDPKAARRRRAENKRKKQNLKLFGA